MFCLRQQYTEKYNVDLYKLIVFSQTKTYISKRINGFYYLGKSLHRDHNPLNLQTWKYRISKVFYFWDNITHLLFEKIALADA